MRLVSVQVGLPRTLRGAGKEWRSAFGKLPVAGEVRALRDGLEGDGQENRVYHGGAEMAALAYGAAAYPRWREELSWPALKPGDFAENLSVEGASEGEVCIGDVWQAGSARLQVSSPRNPCVKIGRFHDRPELTALVEQSGRTGWYLRVLEEGVLQAGQGISLLARPHPEWTVLRAFRTARARKEEPALAAGLAQVAALSPRWLALLRGEPARV